jgi:hypothetical protein
MTYGVPGGKEFGGMRMMLKVPSPVAKGNQAITDGTLARVMQNMIATIKPEAAYAVPVDGKRGGIYVFDLADPSLIPAISEPLFQELDAAVEFIPVMNMDDLMKGLAAAGQAAQGAR